MPSSVLGMYEPQELDSYMFFQWIELRLLTSVYILCNFMLRRFYIIWLNLPLVPLLTHHETRGECRSFTIFVLLPTFFFSTIFTMEAALPFSSPTHFSSRGFSAACTTMSLTPIRPGNSSPASVHPLQLLPHVCKVRASVRPLYFFSCMWDIMKVTSPVES